MITTVFFDLDETLLDDERTAIAAEHKTCQWAASTRPHLDPVRLQDAYHVANHDFWTHYDQANETRSGEQIRHDLWLESLTACNAPDAEFAGQMSHAYRSLRDKSYELFDDALPCLEALRGRYTLGLITNGASTLQRAKINALALEKHMDIIVVAGEVGVSKPDAAIFDAALSQAKCAVHDAAMVGDLLDRDILGAINAGLLPIWINRHGDLDAHSEDDFVPATARVNRAARTPPPQHVIGTLDDLPALLSHDVGNSP